MVHWAEKRDILRKNDPWLKEELRKGNVHAGESCFISYDRVGSYTSKLMESLNGDTSRAVPFINAEVTYDIKEMNIATGQTQLMKQYQLFPSHPGRSRENPFCRIF